ncbi:MAG: hypothetical protein ACRDF7_08875 [Candidatus Limnocylindrales bacterium]
MIRTIESAGLARSDIGRAPLVPPTTTSAEQLAAYGLALMALGWPHVPWGSRFLREFVTVRSQLAPLGSRRLLADSYARESVRPRGQPSFEEARDILRSSAVHAAYAMRWLELAAAS